MAINLPLTDSEAKIIWIAIKRQLVDYEYPELRGNCSECQADAPYLCEHHFKIAGSLQVVLNRLNTLV